MITSDVFLYLRIDLFLYAVFKVHVWLMFISHQKPKPLFSSLITGKNPGQFFSSFFLNEVRFALLSERPKKLSSFASGNLANFFMVWRPPALPHRLQCSTIGRSGLNHRVRDGNGCVPWPHRHQKLWVLSEVLLSLERNLFFEPCEKNFLLITQQ